jgi:hypothetical protein
MDHRITAIERAFQIARSAHTSSVAEIKEGLRKQGYAPEQISGPVLPKELIAIIAVAREKDNAERFKRAAGVAP